MLPNCDDGLSKDVWLEHGWHANHVAPEQLYDLIFDPNETCNLAERPEAPSLLNELRSRLEAWMRETQDPLLAGPIPPPIGAEINRPDQQSPSEPANTVERPLSAGRV